jgi:hypothetical protein
MSNALTLSVAKVMSLILLESTAAGARLGPLFFRTMAAPRHTLFLDHPFGMAV